MSAEKEIVNYWLNKRGFFTINNLKAANKDAGIIGIHQSGEALHVQVMCSITGTDTKEILNSAEKISEEKFYDEAIQNEVKGHAKELHLKKILVLNSVKSRKADISKEFQRMDIEIMEFESIFFESIEMMDTQYHKSDILRTLQLTKFLLFSEPEKMMKLLSYSLNPNSRKEFLSEMLKNKDIMREFKKTNSERLSAILKNSGIKPDELAEILGKDVLGSRSRKVFINSMMDKEKSLKAEGRTRKIRKKNMALGKFF